MSQFAGLSDISISEDIPVEGDITVPIGSQNADNDLSTLDEPVKDTIVSEDVLSCARQVNPPIFALITIIDIGQCVWLLSKLSHCFQCDQHDKQSCSIIASHEFFLTLPLLCLWVSDEGFESRWTEVCPCHVPQEKFCTPQRLYVHPQFIIYKMYYL